MRALLLTSMGVAILGVPSCSGAGDAAPASSRTRVEDSAAGTVALGLGGSGDYRPSRAATGGALSGTVALQGSVAESVVAVTRDAATCGDSTRVLELTTTGTSLGNALVWVDGIAAGKPLPSERRRTMTIERCRFAPRVLAMVVGTTLNVFSRDRVPHRISFYREGGDEPVAWVHTVDDGQVVPLEQVAASPGFVEARCAMHPWIRGYVAVFAHPYFAVTDEHGAFRIEGLPGGTYSVKVWHQGMDRPAERRVVVRDGGVGNVDVAVALK